MKKILLSCFIIGFVAVAIGGATNSVFVSQASLEDNNFSTGTWYVGPEIVINELMWMGSAAGDSNDEWIELRNMTSNTIDLSNWKVTKVASSGSGVESLMLTIPAGKSIGPNGYFLISNYDKATSAINVDPDRVDSGVTLGNSYLKIRLYRGAWSDPTNLIDTAGNGGVPLAGSNGASKQSMSRNSTPDDGTAAGNWYTDIVSNGTSYWDSIDNNYGTPGGPNV